VRTAGQWKILRHCHLKGNGVHRAMLSIARRPSLALPATAPGPPPVDARTSAVRHAEPIAVRLAWWRDDPHPDTQTAVELLTALYRGD